MVALKEKLSEESLEKLCIAVINLKTESGLLTNLLPEDVLQDWVLENKPSFTTRLKNACSN